MLDGLLLELASHFSSTVHPQYTDTTYTIILKFYIQLPEVSQLATISQGIPRQVL